MSNLAEANPGNCAALCHAGGRGDASSRTHFVKYSLEPWSKVELLSLKTH